jgi:hypothetical protein
MDNELGYLYLNESCVKCSEHHNDLSNLHKQLKKLKEDELDTEVVRKNIGGVMKLIKKHKEEHKTNMFKAEDIENIIEITKNIK